jgi:hypothetical protein
MCENFLSARSLEHFGDHDYGDDGEEVVYDELVQSLNELDLKQRQAHSVSEPAMSACGD